jgi:L-lactate dehydrogenase complex protein LldE
MNNTFHLENPAWAGRPTPRVGLFVPCYIDQLFPRIAFATVHILKQCGVEVVFPKAQTCCGQPMANTGCTEETRPLAHKFLQIFSPYDYVVGPSASCVAMVRMHYDEYLEGTPGFEELKAKTFDLVEFLTDVAHVSRIDGSFPHKVGLHNSCHGLRELRLGKASELSKPAFSKPRQLLELLEGIQFATLSRPDECCGFGGTFAIAEEAVSCMMGQDRIHDHEQNGTEILTAGDMSCLMHLDGLIRRDRKPIRVMHIAEILAGVPA